MMENETYGSDRGSLRVIAIGFCTRENRERVGGGSADVGAASRREKIGWDFVLAFSRGNPLLQLQAGAPMN
jgi:hypothetical protein